MPKHCLGVALGDYEQIINNGFVQLEAEWLNDIFFSRESRNLGLFLRDFFKNLY